VSYSEVRERGGGQVEQAISLALEDIARGVSQHQAAENHGAPYSSTNKAWRALGGHNGGTAWLAFCQSLPPAPPPAEPAQSAQSGVSESPLGPRLTRQAARYGDGVPYGQHGPWGLYREGVKEMTMKIAAGSITPTTASEELATVGVNIQPRMLKEKAKLAPGKSPVKGGRKRLLSPETESKINEEIRFYRQHDLPVTKPTVFAIANAAIANSGEQSKFGPNGVTNDWYYSFLDSKDCAVGDTRPLESDRDLWLTSKNAEAQYAVWAEIALRNKMAVPNPAFDPNKPYDEMIHWTSDGLSRLVSMDETDVRTDQTKRGKSQANRGVKAQAAGSRRGHSKRKPGRQPKGAISKGGSVKKRDRSQHANRQPDEMDHGDALVTKAASKISFAGGTLGNGKSLPAYIMSDHPLSQDELAAAPQGTAVDPEGRLLNAVFNVNSSGGMEKADMVKWTRQIAIPATGVTPENRGMLCQDGLGQHYAFEVVQTCVNSGLDIALRFPHGSSRNQHEDFAHFSVFKPAHEQAKIEAQVRQFQVVREKAQAQGRAPTVPELKRAQVITDGTSLQCAKRPWEEAFSETRIKSGWKDEGVVPFTRKLMWDLREEEAAKGIVPPRVPDADLTLFGLPALAPATAAGEAGPSNASNVSGGAGSSTDVVLASSGGGATVPASGGGAIVPAGAAWDEGIDEEVEELLRNEMNDPNLQVTPVPPPKNLPKLGASLLFKLRGGATGEMGLKLIRAKEVERRLKIARVEARQKARAGKKEAQTNSDWQVAADALTDLKSKGYELGSLKKEQLLALVRVLGAGKAQGNKPELAALLTERFGNITSRQFQQIQTTVQRGLALTLLPPPPVAPLPLTEPVQALAEPPAPAEQEQLSLAQRRSRR